jgi:hypothetical protein
MKDELRTRGVEEPFEEQEGFPSGRYEMEKNIRSL